MCCIFSSILLILCLVSGTQTIVTNRIPKEIWVRDWEGNYTELCGMPCVHVFDHPNPDAELWIAMNNGDVQNALNRMSNVSISILGSHEPTHYHSMLKLEYLNTMSTDIDTCALIAAGIESIDKVGPFDCKFRLDTIDDVRAAKKDDIVRRAKEIKQKWATKTVSEGETMLNDVHQGDTGKLATYGPSKLTCSSGVFDSNWVILVEGRADVINLLRAGYDNSLAIEGAKN